MTRVRRRRTREIRDLALLRWQDARERLLGHAEPGERPWQWWRWESGRPDLADGRSDRVALALGDVYPEPLARAGERLRFLRDQRLLDAGEAREIHRRAAIEDEPGRWAWRSRILREARR